MSALRRAAAALPAPVKSAIQAGLIPLDPVMIARYRRRTGDTRPIPPLALRAKVGSPGVEAYVRAGAGLNDLLVTALQREGKTPASFDRVLDLATGSGRGLVALAADWPGPEYHGCDIDEPAIAWLAEHHPELHPVVNGFAPPLPYPDGHFGLVSAISLFTHLDERAQDAWLAEVRRVLRPGGVAVLTVHGARAFEAFASGRVVGAVPPPAIAAHGPFTPRSFVFEAVGSTRWNAVRYIPGGTGWGIAFHGEEYVTERWGRVFGDVRIVRGDGFQEAVLAS